MGASRHEREPSVERHGGLEASIVTHEHAARLLHIVRLREERHQAGHPPASPAPPVETEAHEPRRLHRLPMPSAKFDKPYVDYDEAEKSHPEAFSAPYDKREIGTDRKALRSMVKLFTDDAIINRVESVYADGSQPRDFKQTLTRSSHRDFIRQARRFRLLKPEEEKTLGRNIKIGVAAFNIMGSNDDFTDPVLIGLAREGAYSYQAFLHTNLRLPTSHASKVEEAYPHIQKGALLMYGIAGVQVAIEKFDETKGFRFSTPAMFEIRNAIQRGFKEGRMIHVPNDQEIILRRVDRTRVDIQQSGEKENVTKKLEEEIGLDRKEISYLERVGTTEMHSLNFKPNPDMEFEVGDMLPAPTPLEETDEAIAAKQLLSELFKTPTLDQLDKLILSLRHSVFLEELTGLKVGAKGDIDYEEAFYGIPYGSDKEHPTFAVIGKLLGFGDKQVREKEHAALEKIEAANDPDKIYKSNAH